MVVGIVEQIKKEVSLNPMVTGSPFFLPFFLLPIFVYFAEKVNPWWLQLNPFFLLFLVIPLSTYGGIHIPLRLDFGAKTTLPNKKITSSFIYELLPLINAKCHLYSPPGLVPCPSSSAASSRVPSSFNAIVIRRHRRPRKLP